MSSNSSLRIGVYAYPGLVRDCAVRLKTLAPAAGCEELGLTADVLSKALAVAGIPYTTIPLYIDADSYGFGSFNETSGQWTGE